MMQRQAQIDYMKGLFVMSMLFAHTGQLLGRSLGFGWRVYLSISDPTVFSGFFFCFGFAVWWAYFQRSVLPRKRMLIVAWKFFAAYVISGCAYQILIAGKKANLDLLMRVCFF